MHKILNIVIMKMYKHLIQSCLSANTWRMLSFAGANHQLFKKYQNITERGKKLRGNFGHLQFPSECNLIKKYLFSI